MARRTALLGISLLLTAATTAACADNGAGSADGGATAAQTAFDKRAKQVAEAWRDRTSDEAWRTGFVPLQELTVLPADTGDLPEAIQQALAAGWYTLDAGMPREAGGRKGTIRFPDGETVTVPLITLAQAYAELDQGDPPACPKASVPPPPDAPAGGPGSAEPGGDGPGSAPHVQDPFEPDRTVDPDKPASDAGQPKACVALTITGMRLGTVPLLTSRGEAQVPAWLFTVRELDDPVARVAVAPSATDTPPEFPTGELPPVDGLVAAQDLTAVEGTRLTYRLGVGACDENITPASYEADDVVVVGGTVTRDEGEVCTEQLILHEVAVTLDEPLDARPVLDAATGQVLILQR